MGYDEYLPCSAYENQPAHETAAGFTAFYDEKNENYFFALLDVDGKILLRSEGYPQTPARENGIQSVIKNRTNKDFYSVKEEEGAYFLCLRAANYREIARSCPCESEAAALELIPFMTGEKIRGGAPSTPEISSEKIDDDYLSCKEYEGHHEVDNEGFVKFSHENGKHYFAWYEVDGSLYMRSEGYTTTSARDNGMASVARNRSLEEHYSVLEKMGRYFVILKAGNYQEIARSCPYDSESAALATFPNARAETARLLAEAEANKLAAATAMASAAGAETVSGGKSENQEDDYLACRQYDGHGDADENGFVRWQHTNDLYYFTWVNDKGSVKMRSEGYPTVAARDNVMNSVIRNRDNKDRYVVKEMHGKHFVILKAGNHQEIARSCPKESLDAVGMMFPILGLGAAALSLMDTPSVPKPTVDIIDDYLPCREYHGHMTAPRDGFRVFISPRTDKYYFAVVDEDDDVSLRSEGYLTAQERDADLEDVVKNMHNKEHYEIKQVDVNHYLVLLKNDDGNVIARSCTYSSLAAIYAAIPFLDPAHADAVISLGAPLAMVAAAAAAAISLPKDEPIVAAPIAAVAEEEAAAGGGFPWWWILIPLLAILAWWLFGSKGCGKTEAVAPVITTAAKDTAGKAAIAVIDSPKTDVNAAVNTAVVPPPPPSAPSCDLNWIFFDFDKSNIRSDAAKELAEMAKILKDNKDYVGVLSAHTDGKGTDTYNEALSSRRAENAKSTLIRLGIAANRLSTMIEGKNAPVAKNTDDDNGRHYNRRVELYIRDKAGKDICKSVPPAIPTELKAQ